MDKQLEIKRDFAIEMAKNAMAIMRGEFKPKMEKSLKKDKSFVTETDLKINDMVISEVKKRFPDHSVIAEEGNYISNKGGNYIYVCDPLDGTIAFSHDTPTFCFSLSLVEKGNGMPIIGVANNFDRSEDFIYSAVKGHGAFLSGKHIHVSKDSRLKGSVIGLANWTGAQFDMTSLYKRLVDSGAGVLMPGSIVFSGLKVSSGEYSVAIHPARMSYETPALKVIVEEAGGRETDLFGKNNMSYDKIRGSVLSNGILHDEIVALMRK
ncbi:MAG: inositol monophosphatase [Candidatus Micrarchaeota archaeon]|nr:inositol monophosphatase [Candidatus Micrarchaeota archaeon]